MWLRMNHMSWAPVNTVHCMWYTSEPEWRCLPASGYESVIENLRGKLHTATETISGTNAKRLTEEAASRKNHQWHQCQAADRGSCESESSRPSRKAESQGIPEATLQTNVMRGGPLQRKDTEITELRKQFSFPETSPGSMGDKGMSLTKSTTSSHKRVETIHPILRSTKKGTTSQRLTGEEATIHWDDWLPTLEWAA